MYCRKVAKIKSQSEEKLIPSSLINAEGPYNLLVYEEIGMCRQRKAEERKGGLPSG